MQINILFEFKTGAWGGGNQFLKALKNEFIRLGVYVENPEFADIILFNSHHNLSKILKLKQKYPEKKFIHRVDGPIFLIRNKDIAIDKLIFKFSQEIADFSIFQSHWSLDKCKKLGFEGENIAVIYNAPDPDLFNRNGKYAFDISKKIRIIANSWSPSWSKGFGIYQYLDVNLDFNKYEFVFVGNSPVKFENILQINPLPSIELAKELKKSAIFITASKNDPCSNSLIEALSCGLPAVAFNDGGHPELIQNGGEVFEKHDEIIGKIEKIAKDYLVYQKNIPNYNISEIANQYQNIFFTISASPAKELSLAKHAALRYAIIWARVRQIFEKFL